MQDQEDREITDVELAALSGFSRVTLQMQRQRGTGCTFVKRGRAVRYRMSDVRAWLQSAPTYRSTSEYPEAAKA